MHKREGTTGELREITEFQKLVTESLLASYHFHQSLGERGRTEVKQNRFGENALVADVGAEEVIIDKLKSCGLPMRIVSEEHGQLTTGDQAIATAIIDGLDGSSVYKKQGLDGRYSTMLGVLRGSKPRYKDTMTSGIIEHSRHRLLFSDRNSQTRVRDLISLQEQPVKTSGKKTLDSQTRFYIDDYSAEERAVYNDILLPHFPNTTCGGASATYYIDTALGAADAVIEWTRKNNLEIAVAYQIIQKAGGVMVDRNGNDLGEQLYDEYGQRQGEPVITAATPELAEAIIKLLFTSR